MTLCINPEQVAKEYTEQILGQMSSLNKQNLESLPDQVIAGTRTWR